MHTESKVHAYHWDGTKKWTYTLSTNGVEGLDFNPDTGVVYAAQDASVVAINSDGTKKWEGSGSFSYVYEVTYSNSSHSVYVGGFDATLHQLNADDGTENWWEQLGNQYEKVYNIEMLNGYIYAGTQYSNSEDRTYKVNESGGILWTHNYGHTDNMQDEAVSEKKDWVSFGSGTNTLALNPDNSIAFNRSNTDAVKGVGINEEESSVKIYHGTSSGVKKIDTGETLTSSVSGTVTDDSGNPISQANITVEDTSDGSVVYETQTDANGDWSTELGDGDYAVTAQKYGYEKNTTTFSVAGSAVQIDQTLYEDKYSVSGYILDGQGDPVGDASVTVKNDTGTVTTLTSGGNGYYSTSLTNGSYSLEAEANGYKNGSITATVDGAPLDNQNITLGQDTISGTVEKTDGTPCADCTVKLLAVNFSALDVQDPSEYEERANELIAESENVTPPEWDPDADLKSNFSETEGVYVAAHTKDDWDVRGFDVKELDFVPTASKNLVTLSQPKTQFDADEKVVVSVWNAEKDPWLQDSADEDLPGVTDSGTVVFQQVGPGGEELNDPLRVNTTKMVQTQAPIGKKHEAAVADLPTGFYRVYPESNPAASYLISVGDPESRIEGWRDNLETKAGSLTDQAKTIRNRIDSHKFEPITTTTNAKGEWSVTANTHLEKTSIIAYKVPPALNKDPQNATMDDLNSVFEMGTYNGSYVLPADAERVDVPKSNVTVRVVGTDAPGYADPRQYANLRDWFNNFIANHSYAEAIPVLQQRLAEADDEQAKELYRQWLNLAKENEDLREKATENNGGKTIIRERTKVVEKINNTNTSEMQSELQALRESLSELRTTIDNGTVESTTSEGNVSLRFPFDTNLSPDQVAVLVHYSNGTTRTLSPQNSSYVSIDSNVGGDDVVISEFPLNGSDAAVATFDVTVATPDGTGHASERVKNPTFDGDVPSLAAIDLSTLRPGPDEHVRLTLQPDADAKFKRLESVTVYGPDGNEITANVTNSRTGQFTTTGAGTYHIQTVYSNLDGKNFTTTVQITAGDTDQKMPAGLRVVESVVGTYALTGEGLDSGSVELAEGGSEVRVFARISNTSDVPGQLHVYTHAVTLPPDSNLDVHVVRGEERRAVSKTVGVTIHTASLPEDSYVYRNGQPLPQDKQTRHGRIKEQGGHTVISTYTDDSGSLTVSTNANPGYWDKAVWLWQTTMPDLPDLPFSASIPLGAVESGGASIPALGVVGVAFYRRRRAA